MTTLPSNLEHLLLLHLNDGRCAPGVEVSHTRGKSRGGVLRLKGDNGETVIAKLWQCRNPRERLKMSLRLSNACREWRMHRFLHDHGLPVPGPLAHLRLATTDGSRCEAIVVKDIGPAEQGLSYVKRLLAEGAVETIEAFEDRLIQITDRLIQCEVLDIDHQLNNILIDERAEVWRIDFECARVRRLRFAHAREFATMLARLVASHAYACQPDVSLTELFSSRLFAHLRISSRTIACIETHLREILAEQHRLYGIDSRIELRTSE